MEPLKLIVLLGIKLGIWQTILESNSWPEWWANITLQHMLQKLVVMILNSADNQVPSTTQRNSSNVTSYFNTNLYAELF